jgi:hypothetical protein
MDKREKEMGKLLSLAAMGIMATSTLALGSGSAGAQSWQASPKHLIKTAIKSLEHTNGVRFGLGLEVRMNPGPVKAKRANLKLVAWGRVGTMATPEASVTATESIWAQNISQHAWFRAVAAQNGAGVQVNGGQWQCSGSSSLLDGVSGFLLPAHTHTRAAASPLPSSVPMGSLLRSKEWKRVKNLGLERYKGTWVWHIQAAGSYAYPRATVVSESSGAGHGKHGAHLHRTRAKRTAPRVPYVINLFISKYHGTLRRMNAHIRFNGPASTSKVTPISLVAGIAPNKEPDMRVTLWGHFARYGYTPHVSLPAACS